MAQPKVFVPSRALLKALSRPLPPQCLSPRGCLVQLARGKRTRAAPASRSKVQRRSEGSPWSKEQTKLFEEMKKRMASAMWAQDITRPMTEEEIQSDDLPVINWYEQDLDKGTPRRLVKTIATPEDRRREQELGLMIEESFKNPDYDDTELNRRLLDDLIADPDYADLKDSLIELKEDLLPEDEMNALVADTEKQLNEGAEEYRNVVHQALQNLIEDPNLVEARDELLDAQAKLPGHENFDEPEFQAALEKAMALLKDNEAFQKKMAALGEDPANIEYEQEMAEIEKGLNEVIAASEEDVEEDMNFDLDPEESEGSEATIQLLVQLRKVLKSLGDESSIIAEIDEVLHEDPEAVEGFDFDDETDPSELVEELKKLAEARPGKKVTNFGAFDGIDIPDGLRAKIDDVVADPDFLNKLVDVQKFISDQQAANITLIPHETAPDPNDLEDFRTTTVEEQILVALHSPKHIAAIRRLHVRLGSPYNKLPALQTFNQAIELAYVGANDNIRRALWRAYQKARTIPTFLDNISDEAWDILYYSQAVKWPSNQNRDNHLKAILADLKSLGRDGPPTHPSSLVE